MAIRHLAHMKICNSLTFSDDLEEQCEDALFEVCDARERYPLLCAEELEKCLRLTTEIQTIKVVPNIKVYHDIEPQTEEQNALLNIASKKQNIPYKHQGTQLKKMLNKIDNLKMVIEQIEKEKFCEINKLFHT
ncbi:uncharacterized protein V1477_007820 [Vespula maculifrons]|uniref:Uncharacterized protein n=2 Tax=Vespula TaxID=7451 RepID=A0ABD2CGA4_VESMC|nr:uncharacterized protein LOC127072031 isoform X1 [Vespula vulgaris]